MKLRPFVLLQANGPTRSPLQLKRLEIRAGVSYRVFHSRTDGVDGLSSCLLHNVALFTSQSVSHPLWNQMAERFSSVKIDSNESDA